MIISAISRDTAIRENIQQTLEQIKVGGKPNKRLTIEHVGEDSMGDCSVSFYVDADRTQLLFSENNDDHPDSFVISGTRTYYTPPDEKINFAPKLSDEYAQKLYYANAEFSDGVIKVMAYRNVDNLMFQNVIVASKKNPQFTTNEDTCIIVPVGQKTQNPATSDDRQYVVLSYELYLQLTIFNWERLSEADRLEEAEQVNNIVRNALYADRYRDGNATTISADLNGTNVGQIELLPSDALLKAKTTVQCVFMASSATY